LQLVHLYAEKDSPKDEKARWLERYLTEGSPRLEGAATESGAAFHEPE
jgi:hypothetical protein